MDLDFNIRVNNLKSPMKNILALIFSTFFYVSCIAQQSSVHQKNDSLLDKITNELCICYNKNSDKSEDYVDKLLIRECLEESTEQNLKEIIKYYNVSSFKEINLKKYFDDLKPKISEGCKLSKEFINESFKTTSSE